MAKQFLTDIDFGNIAQVKNMKDGVNPQDGATVGQLNAAIEGLSTKDNVVAASTGSVTLTSPGVALDGITLAVGNRILLKDQTTLAENGIYIWNGGTTALTRSADANLGTELLSAVVTVDQGTSNKGTTWRQTEVNLTLGTSDIKWTPFGVVTPPASTTTAGAIQIATQAEVNAGTSTNKAITPQTLTNWTGLLHKLGFYVGDGSTTQFDLAHNLATQDVEVQVYRNSSPYDTVECDVERISTTTIRVRFAVAPTTNAYRVLVIG